MAATTPEPATGAPGLEQASALDRALGIGRRAIVPISLFSMAFNLLGLAVPLYTMQIYDRVLPGGSRETLLYLVLATVGVLAVAAALDVLRAEIGVRIGGWLERHLAPQAFIRAIEGRMSQRPYGSEALRDLATLRGSSLARPRSRSAMRSGRRSTSPSCSCCTPGSASWRWPGSWCWRCSGSSTRG
jgi:hypothetical protein